MPEVRKRNLPINERPLYRFLDAARELAGQYNAKSFTQLRPFAAIYLRDYEELGFTGKGLGQYRALTQPKVRTIQAVIISIMGSSNSERQALGVRLETAVGLMVGYTTNYQPIPDYKDRLTEVLEGDQAKHLTSEEREFFTDLNEAALALAKARNLDVKPVVSTASIQGRLASVPPKPLSRSAPEPQPKPVSAHDDTADHRLKPVTTRTLATAAGVPNGAVYQHGLSANHAGLRGALRPVGRSQASQPEMPPEFMKVRGELRPVEQRKDAGQEAPQPPTFVR